MAPPPPQTPNPDFSRISRFSTRKQSLCEGGVRWGKVGCLDYQFLDGSMRKTQPVCGANTMMWVLQEEMVPAATAVRFLTRVRNPPRTPESNLFQVRQVSPSGKRKSSRMITGYAIVPELSGVTVQWGGWMRMAGVGWGWGKFRLGSAVGTECWNISDNVLRRKQGFWNLFVGSRHMLYGGRGQQ